jgi:hypothetical protein
MEEMEILEEGTTDGVCHGICMNKNCDYTCEVEPDQDKGWCEMCKTKTVKSALMIAGII